MEELNSFVFFSSYFEAISVVKSKKSQLLLFESICKYALYNEEPEQLSKEIYGIFLVIKPNIDASQKRRKASISNGSQGGAPKGNQNAKKQPKNKPSEQPKNNLNKEKDMDMDKDMDKDKEGEKDIDSKNQPPPRGRYKNVFLSESEYQELEKEYTDLNKMIDHLSEYMKMCGKHYESHYATLKKWAEEDHKKVSNGKAELTEADREYNRNFIKSSKTAQMLEESYKMMCDWANEK